MFPPPLPALAVTSDRQVDAPIMTAAALAALGLPSTGRTCPASNSLTPYRAPSQRKGVPRQRAGLER
jgi:hypothetical protein